LGRFHLRPGSLLFFGVAPVIFLRFNGPLLSGCNDILLILLAEQSAQPPLHGIFVVLIRRFRAAVNFREVGFTKTCFASSERKNQASLPQRNRRINPQVLILLLVRASPAR